MQFRDWLGAWLQEHHDGAASEGAVVVGIDQSMLSRYLNGRTAPSRQTAKKIAASTGIPLANLLEMIDEQDRATANQQGVPADVNAFGMPRGFADMVWERLSQPAKDRIIESVRIEVEEAVERGEI